MASLLAGRCMWYSFDCHQWPGFASFLNSLFQWWNQSMRWNQSSSRSRCLQESLGESWDDWLQFYPSRSSLHVCHEPWYCPVVWSLWEKACSDFRASCWFHLCCVFGGCGYFWHLSLPLLCPFCGGSFMLRSGLVIRGTLSSIVDNNFQEYILCHISCIETQSRCLE